MYKTILERVKQKKRTIPFPSEKITLPERYRGVHTIDQAKCAECVEKQCLHEGCCPTEALRMREGKLIVDLGRCLFCANCKDACPCQAIAFTREYRMATTFREHLHLTSHEVKRAKELAGELGKILGRSLKLRQVSAGGCNACEADTNVLNTLAFDLGRFGIQFVASPRHADGLLLTGPISKNMELALMKTYQAIPTPKIVIAVGACAISGGAFASSSEVVGGVDSLYNERGEHPFPVDLYVPGCPPHPLTILDGLLRLLNKTK